ncbi:glycosyltransferase [Clostridium tarantellae]|nr:glycosyltransferase [Clostridium tarantellae]
MNKIKVSIIVPVYNVKDYLEECINSLRKQTLYNIEIILINDGSTDSSGDICNKYSLLDKRVKVIHQKNMGQSVARNRGLKNAIGEYVIFIDSDDYVSLDMCKKMYNIAKKYDLDIVHGDLLNEKEIINKNKNFRKIPSENKVIEGIQYIKESINNNSYDIVTWLNFIKRDFLINNKIEFLEGRFYEDQEYTLKLLTVNKNRFMKIRFPFYYYRPCRKGSTTNVPNLKKGIDSIEIINSMINYVVNLNSIKENKIYMYMVISQSYYHLSSLWVRMNKEDKNIIIKKVNKNILWNDYISKYKYPNNRIKIQNFIFSKSPKTLNFIYNLKNSFIVNRG